MKKCSVCVYALVFIAGVAVLALPASAASATLDVGRDKLNVVSPYRAIDTRSGDGGRLRAGNTRRVVLRSTPPGATAALLNVAVTKPTGAGHVTTWDCNGAKPTVSNLNFTKDDTHANQVIAQLDPQTQAICFESPVDTELIVDVFGWFGAPSSTTNLSYVAITPRRVFDSRQTVKFAAQSVRRVSFASAVPKTAKAVTFNLTQTEVEYNGHVTAWDCDGPPPTVSVLNSLPGTTRPNKVTVPINADREVCLFARSPQNLIADVVGYWAGNGGTQLDLDDPIRVLDTRIAGRPIGDNQDRVLVAQQHGVLVGQLTGVNSSAPGYFSLYPCADGFQGTSTVNFTGPGETASVGVFMRMDRGGICVHSVGGADLILDRFGAWVADQSTTSQNSPSEPSPKGPTDASPNGPPDASPVPQSPPKAPSPVELERDVCYINTFANKVNQLRATNGRSPLRIGRPDSHSAEVACDQLEWSRSHLNGTTHVHTCGLQVISAAADPVTTWNALVDSPLHRGILLDSQGVEIVTAMMKVSVSLGSSRRYDIYFAAVNLCVA